MSVNTRIPIVGKIVCVPKIKTGISFYQYRVGNDLFEYKGEWKSGFFKNGKLFKNKFLVFEGYFQEGYTKNGKEYVNGRILYEGEYGETKGRTKGKMFFNENCYFEGDFKDGQPHHGTTYKQERTSTGFFKTFQGISLLHGKGRVTFSGSLEGDLVSHEGEFYKGKPIGKCKEVYRSGAIFRGTYEGGKRVSGFYEAGGKTFSIEEFDSDEKAVWKTKDLSKSIELSSFLHLLISLFIEYDDMNRGFLCTNIISGEDCSRLPSHFKDLIRKNFPSNSSHSCLKTMKYRIVELLYNPKTDEEITISMDKLYDERLSKSAFGKQKITSKYSEIHKNNMTNMFKPKTQYDIMFSIKPYSFEEFFQKLGVISNEEKNLKKKSLKERKLKEDVYFGLLLRNKCHGFSTVFLKLLEDINEKYGVSRFSHDGNFLNFSDFLAHFLHFEPSQLNIFSKSESSQFQTNLDTILGFPRIELNEKESNHGKNDGSGETIIMGKKLFHMFLSAKKKNGDYFIIDPTRVQFGEGKVSKIYDGFEEYRKSFPGKNVFCADSVHLSKNRNSIRCKFGLDEQGLPRKDLLQFRKSYLLKPNYCKILSGMMKLVDVMMMMKETSQIEQLKFCSNCSRREKDLKSCKNCKKRFYCGRICQLLDWKRHKLECKNLK